MPVYHLVFHSFGSWLPDQAAGFIDRDRHYRLRCNMGLGQYCRERAHQPPVSFSDSQQDLLLQACHELSRDQMGLHAVAVVETHIHLVISWNSGESVTQIVAMAKQRLTYNLNKHQGSKKGRWFSRGAGIHRVRDMDHLIDLVRRYIPSHGKNVWIEERIRLKL